MSLKKEIRMYNEDSWYGNVRLVPDENCISTRVRLSRNIKGAAFPTKLTAGKRRSTLLKLKKDLEDISSTIGEETKLLSLKELREIDKIALRERRVINTTLAEAKAEVGLVLSDKEHVSIAINGDDHLRIQSIREGNELNKAWAVAKSIVDDIEEKEEYAFSERYGYLTAFPTNVGTGMRANMVLHLPYLAQGNKFSEMLSSMARIGVTVRGVYGNGKENYGNLFDISNAQTLGITEKEILELVQKMGLRLSDQENRVRHMAIAGHKNRIADEAFKSYGILSYARRLSLKEGLMYLSSVLSGIKSGIMQVEGDASIYSLYLGIQPGNLLQKYQKPMDNEELDIARAEWIREHLPKVWEVK